MPDILPLRPTPVKTKPLSTLLSRSKDDFYSELQAFLNAVPTSPADRSRHSADTASDSLDQ